MKRIVVKRALLAVSALSAATGFIAVATPAQAAPGAILGVAGSDTTEEFMARIALPANGDYNIPARPGAAGFNVPGDGACGSITYTNGAPTPAPNGSSAGIAALAASPGCIDIARSSRGPRAGDPLSLNFNAFALDNVTWASPSLKAPPTLTIEQLRAIYQCTITDWSAVGGSPGPIKPFLAQAGSGTQDVFVREVLGFTPTTTCVPAAQVVQENTGKDLNLTGNLYQQAILPYSVGQWIYQDILKANANADLRNGVQLGTITNVPGGPADPHPVLYSGASRRFFQAAGLVTEARAVQTKDTDGSGSGVRFLYNVTQDATPQVAAAETLVGAGSPLCSGAKASDITSVGFSTIPNVGGSTCRFYTP